MAGDKWAATTEYSRQHCWHDRVTMAARTPPRLAQPYVSEPRRNTTGCTAMAAISGAPRSPPPLRRASSGDAPSLPISGVDGRSCTCSPHVRREGGVAGSVQCGPRENSRLVRGSKHEVHTSDGGLPPPRRVERNSADSLQDSPVPGPGPRTRTRTRTGLCLSDSPAHQ